METKIVLLIDDSTVVSSRLISMLQDDSNSSVILQATSYADALNMMEAFRPDFVLIDIAMSDRKGISFLKEINDSRKDAKVAVITNLTNPWYRNFCEEMGVNYFLDKSTEFELVPKLFSTSVLN